MPINRRSSHVTRYRASKCAYCQRYVTDLAPNPFSYSTSFKRRNSPVGYPLSILKLAIPRRPSKLAITHSTILRGHQPTTRCSSVNINASTAIKDLSTNIHVRRVFRLGRHSCTCFCKGLRSSNWLVPVVEISRKMNWFHETHDRT